MFTADNITDDQIRTLGAALVAEGAYCRAMWCDYALVPEHRLATTFIPKGCDRATARAKCAAFLNARAS